MSSPKPLVTAAAYCRAKTNNAAAIAAQRRLIARYAEQHGFKIVAWYVDAPARGDSIQRTGLLTMLADAADRDFYVVLCVSLQTLSDLPMETSTWLFEGLKRRGQDVVTVNRGRLDIRELVRPSLLRAMAHRRLVRATQRRFARRGDQ
ncbi:MAG: recombinase family protein [Planctomycetales bacterium]|nr:recombinase family protein [Planctomycetales bacterium]